MLSMGRIFTIPPIYKFTKHLTKDGDSLYSATLRLPPNQVFTQTLEVDLRVYLFFKKAAKRGVRVVVQEFLLFDVGKRGEEYPILDILPLFTLKSIN